MEKVDGVVLDDSDVVCDSSSSEGSSGNLNGLWLLRADAERDLAFSLVDFDRFGTTLCKCGFE